MTSNPAILQPRFLEEVFTPFKLNLNSFIADSLLLNSPVAEVEVISAVEYLHSELLVTAIKRIATEIKTDKLFVAASLWNKHYNNALLPGVFAYMTLLGVGLDASLNNTSFVLSDGIPQALLLHKLDNTVIYAPRFPTIIPKEHTGNLLSEVSELHRFVFYNLFQQHLAVAIERIHSLTKLSKKIMWGNAGNLCVYLYDEFAKCPGTEVTQTEDRSALLEQQHSLVMLDQNPLYHPIDYEQLTEPGLPPVMKVRRTCCQLYRALELKHCGSCPLLKLEERITRLKQHPAK